jgi:hypothetical protein
MGREHSDRRNHFIYNYIRDHFQYLGVQCQPVGWLVNTSNRNGVESSGRGLTEVRVLSWNLSGEAQQHHEQTKNPAGMVYVPAEIRTEHHPNKR